MASIGEFAAAIGAADHAIRDACTSIAFSIETTEGLQEQFQRLGADDKAEQIEAVRDGLERQLVQLTVLGEQTKRAKAAAEALRGSSSSPGSAPPVPATRAVQPVRPLGEWATPPRRSFGSEFNERYERYVKTTNGGPTDDREYKVVTNEGHIVWFDARRIEDRGGEQVEVLLDAKGNYRQFVEPDGEDFKWFFRERGGLTELLNQSRRQVAVAEGRRVEWWCADEDFADVFNDYLDRQPDLAGRIEAVYRPMPDEGGLR